MEENNKNENIKEDINQMMQQIPRVFNMSSPNGNDIPNQFEIEGEDFSLFQSYRSPIAMRKGGKTYIFKDWDYSTTTGKYRNQFLGETKQETWNKLKSGEYIAVGFEVA